MFPSWREPKRMKSDGKADSVESLQKVTGEAGRRNRRSIARRRSKRQRPPAKGSSHSGRRTVLYAAALFSPNHCSVAVQSRSAIAAPAARPRTSSARRLEPAGVWEWPIEPARLVRSRGRSHSRKHRGFAVLAANREGRSRKKGGGSYANPESDSGFASGCRLRKPPHFARLRTTSSIGNAMQYAR